QNISDKFNNNAIKVLQRAIFLAGNDKNILKPKHILTAIIEQEGSIASNILNTFKKMKGQSPIQVKQIQNNIEINTNDIVLSKNTQKVFQKTILIASIYRHKFIGTEHLLAAILETNDSHIIDWVKKNQIDVDSLKNKLKAIFETISSFPAFYGNCNSEDSDLNDEFSEIGSMFTTRQNPKQAQKDSYLNNFCNELTDKNFQQDITPVIGRAKEINRLIQILSRRSKNNPILIGEAGVGKTAIIEGLAKKIINNDVPQTFINKKIFSLDVNGLIAGTIFRGEFESRLKNLISELSDKEDAIIFIDEIHNIVGAGSNSGTMDIANILKPALAKGKIKFIGATTLNEYKKYIEKDTALERRFQPITIEEPSIEASIDILEGIKENYENHHNLYIDSSAIELAVKLSSRYIQDRLLPDKAIDIIDEASSKYTLNRKQIIPIHKIKELEDTLSEIIKEKEDNVLKEKFDLAIKWKEKEKIVEKKLLKLKNSCKKCKKYGVVTKKEIYQTISDIMNIPQKDIATDDLKSNILNIESEIKTKFVAQDETLKKIIYSLKRNAIGMNAPQRPLASFLFLGPSGVGKTELAKVLSEKLFKNKKSLIRIDMSEYAESFNISKLIGAPAGYVGFEQGGGLTEKIRENPYSIVLFDEIEKGHKSIYNLLLQILEDGHITDASGRLINFKNTIIIMTSNIGLNELKKNAEIGFSQNEDKQIKNNEIIKYSKLKNKILDDVNKHFPVEFLNRIDDILFFDPLKLEDIKKIISLNLKEMSGRILDENKIELFYGEKVINHLAQKALNPKHGARLVRKIIQENLENLIADKIIDGEIKGGEQIRITVKRGKVGIEKNFRF
ncbi:ATP-dependent Clp protease ATP-binding subunit, partial [Patescibacteria group bacterium]